MGLDTVELLMAFEEEFGMAIPDADASELTTPRQVTDYVMSKLYAAHTKKWILTLTAHKVRHRSSHSRTSQES